MTHVSLYERARTWVLAGWCNRVVIYALVGVLNTAVDYGLFLIAHTVLGLPLVAANALSWVIAVSNSYMLHSTITSHPASSDGLPILRRSWLPSRSCFCRCGWQSC
jgi:putative flippase GtrA